MASAAAASAVCAILMLALRPVAFSAGLVDAPGGRKFHTGHIPITGGIAMFAGMLIGLGLVGLPANVLFSTMGAASMLVIIGVLDDRYGLPASVRLASQFVAVILMVYGAGLYLADIGDPFGTGIISMGRYTLIFTTLVTLTTINAYNFVDGADGLAGTLTLIALLSVAVIAGLDHMAGAAALTVSAVIAAFLIFNFPLERTRNVRSFMGDAGSTLLGFTVVWITLSVCQGPDRLVSPVHCLWIAALPIFDFLSCFVRRIRKGKSPFAPGRDHFHHILLRGGLSVRQALGILTGLQLVYAIAGVMCARAGVADVVMFTTWSILGFSQLFVIRAIARHRRRHLLRALRQARQLNLQNVPP